MGPYDFTSVDAVRRYKTVDGSGLDALLADLVPRATTEIQADLNRKLYQDAWVHRFSGARLNELQLRERPVASITAVYDSLDQIWNASTLLSSSDYLFDPESGVLCLKYGRRFLNGFNNVRVEYVGGWQACPPEVEGVAIELVCMAIEGRDHLVASSVAMGDGSRTIMRMPGLARQQRERIGHHRYEVVA